MKPSSFPPEISAFAHLSSWVHPISFRSFKDQNFELMVMTSQFVLIISFKKLLISCQICHKEESTHSRSSSTAFSESGARFYMKGIFKSLRIWEVSKIEETEAYFTSHKEEIDDIQVIEDELFIVEAGSCWCPDPTAKKL